MCEYYRKPSEDTDEQQQQKNEDVNKIEAAWTNK